MCTMKQNKACNAWIEKICHGRHSGGSLFKVFISLRKFIYKYCEIWILQIKLVKKGLYQQSFWSVQLLLTFEWEGVCGEVGNASLLFPLHSTSIQPNKAWPFVLPLFLSSFLLLMEDLTNLLATVTLVPSGSAMVGFQVPSSLHFNFECQILMLLKIKIKIILMCAHVCMWKRLDCYSLFYSSSELFGPENL